MNPKVKKAIRSVLKFTLSTFGLIVLTFTWVFVGGKIFEKIEGTAEVRVKNETLQFIFGQFYNKVLNTSAAHYQRNSINQAQYEQDIDDWVTKLVQTCLEALNLKGWNGELSEGEGKSQVAWTYANAVLYAATVVTTIGYGHIAPKTTGGRMLTIFYALVGIPITMVTLAKIGHIMGLAFRFLYFYSCQFCRWVSTFCCQKKDKEEKNSNTNAPLARSKSDDYRRLKKKIAKADTTTRVPILISLSVLVLYVVLGSYFFTNASNDEDEWTYLVGCYFCFTTISTIGFGDFVFGQDVVALTGDETWWERIEKQKKLFFTCIYIMVGLSINSMCIDLVASEIMQKAHSLAVRLGFSKDDDDNDSDDGF